MKGQSGQGWAGAEWAGAGWGRVGRPCEGACLAFILSTEVSSTDHCEEVLGVTLAGTDTPGSMIFIPFFEPPELVSLILSGLEDL